MRRFPLVVAGVFSCSFLLPACSSGDPPLQGTGGTGPASSSESATTTASASASASSTTTGATTGTGGGQGIGEPTDVYPAPHSPAPTVTSPSGGQVLAAPRVYPVFFAGDTPGTVNSLIDFYAKIGPSAYWTTTVAEYGVGPLSSGTPIQLAETAPSTITFEEIDAWVTEKLNSNDPAFAAVDESSMLAINYPAGVTVDLGGSPSCGGWGGYHENVILDAAHGNKGVSYLVIPRCQQSGESQLDTTTGTAAHELIEAATDPLPLLVPAYASLDAEHAYWHEVAGGSEIADMCATLQGSFYKDPEIGYVVQRTWSNQAAAAGHDPCIPAPGGQAYFNSAPVLDDIIKYDPQTGDPPVDVKGVHIPVGASKIVEIDLFSDADVGPWTVKAMDADTLFGAQATLQLALDATSGQNGQKLHLEITPTKANQSKYETFVLISERGGQQHFWVGLVGN